MHDNVPVQVLGQVLKAVKELHGAGYAHRNIKPSNILRRLKQHDWVLFDFASSAPLSASSFWTKKASLGFAQPTVYNSSTA
jgi:serine/threonine protein kinase